MTPQRICAVVSHYEEFLNDLSVPKNRISIDRKGPFPESELLSHAHFLIDGVKQFALEEEKIGKANRHLASVQMILWFTGKFSLSELMEHNASP